VNEAPLVYDLDFDELTSFVSRQGEPGFRARQIWHGLYRRLSEDPSSLTDLPAPFRSRLAEALRFDSGEVLATAHSQDGGTEKAVLRLRDGVEIEAVLMRYRHRRTACISTQAGCAMGCVFCATGQMGFARNLTSGEIVVQVLHFARRLAAEGESLTNVVVMGMGEPFHNYDATLAAIDMLKDLIPVDHFARQRYGIPLNIGISIHTGEAVVGNIGFDRKMEYTVIGDVVNDTFRLQDIAREKPNAILISKATEREVGRFIRTRSLGVRSLGAQESEMEVYEVLGTEESSGITALAAEDHDDPAGTGRL